MRLTDFAPEWIMQKKARVVGVRFSCPHCRETQLSVLFLNPPDGGPSQPEDAEFPGNNWGHRWARSGLTFDDLTLHPSIDASGSGGHWHGHVIDGELRTA